MTTEHATNIPHSITIAADTEFQGAHTLTIQTACRVDRRSIAAQVYRSPLIPDLPTGFDLPRYFPPASQQYGRFFERFDLHPSKLIIPELSPGCLLRDLLRLPCELLSRHDGQMLIQDHFGRTTPLPVNITEKNHNGNWKVPKITVSLVLHFQSADFYRVLGRNFWDELLVPFFRDPGEVAVQSGKRLKFVDCRWRSDYNDPIVEYLRTNDGRFFAISMSHADTTLPFGAGSLDGHCQTFLNINKNDAITGEQKSRMREVFEQHTHDAYGYALSDAVNTLLVYERMKQQHADMYAAFDFTPEESPPMRHTLGTRVAEFITRTAQRSSAPSCQLNSRRKLKALVQRGGSSLFRDNSEVSRFGDQVASVHGGLLFSRCPTKLWHEAPGCIRDVDLGGCYNRIVSNINVYCGRPLIFEPGRHRWTLRQAVEYVREHSPQDGWMVRVTGDISSAPNVLIPSSRNALTSDNYRSRTAQQRARKGTLRGFELDYLRRLPTPTDEFGAKLFSARVESGVVTHATWLMIQAMPDHLRQEYESLTADAIVFYPNHLIANDGREYDEIVARLHSEELPWDAVLNLQRGEIVRTEHLDSDFVSLCYPISEYAEQIGHLRRQAQEREGRGSGADKSFKLLANSMFGVIASEHLETHNFVAANIVTATARAIACGMMLSLNGMQVITDGCTYRSDQIPHASFRECLELRPDFPIRRVDEDDGITFRRRQGVPSEDGEFTTWFQRHVKQFFGVQGQDYDELFGIHALVHKSSGEPPHTSFDALAVDGSGNYLKCRARAGGGWDVEDMAARSYRRDSKELLKDWIVDTYSTDELTEPPPMTVETELLKMEPARQKARKALLSGIPEVMLPLGMAHTRVMNYKVIKPSSFVFQDPQQLGAFEKAVDKFQDKCGCGLEIRALRRGYGERRRGSIVYVAEEIYQLIREGVRDFTKAMNLTRPMPRVQPMIEARLAALNSRREQADRRLMEAIDTRHMAEDGKIVGYFVTRDCMIEAHKSEAASVTADGAQASWT